MAHGFLVHADKDDVGVAVRDLAAGETVTGVYQKSLKETSVTLTEMVPLGHKVALTNLKVGDNIIEYNEVIGIATQPIYMGNPCAIIPPP